MGARRQRSALPWPGGHAQADRKLGGTIWQRRGHSRVRPPAARIPETTCGIILTWGQMGQGCGGLLVFSAGATKSAWGIILLRSTYEMRRIQTRNYCYRGILEYSEVSNILKC